MGQDSKIQWTHHTFNPWWGCTKVSPGCAHCYAESFSKRYGHAVWGKDAPRRTFGYKHWNEPVKWNAEAEKAGERRRVFCASMADVFEDREDLDGERMRLFELIDKTKSLDWLLLTKRPERIDAVMERVSHGSYGSAWNFANHMPNVWLGTTCEDMAHAEERIPHLTSHPATCHFLSVEPQLGVVTPSLVTGAHDIEWVICGGESGNGARAFDANWARVLRADTQNMGAAFFMKQMGGVRDKRGELDQFPEDLRIREFPQPVLESI